MTIVFIDAENIGLSALKTLQWQEDDRVMVYARTENVMDYCQQRLWVCHHHYQQGSNQADFLIIAHLAKLIEKAQTCACTPRFLLCSNDNALIQAFKDYCHHAGVSADIKRTKAAPCSKPTQCPLEKKLLEALKKGRPLNTKLQTELGMSKTDFFTLTQTLTQQQKIRRSKSNGANWVAV